MHVSEEKVKFDLNQNMPFTDEETMMCVKIDSLLPPIEEHVLSRGYS